MNDVLTIMELSDINLDNSTLCGFLKLIDLSHSYLDANQLRNSTIWAKREIIHHDDIGKRAFLMEKGLKVMFNDVISRPDSVVAVRHAEDLYRFTKGHLENCQKTWKVETYLQMLHTSDYHFDYEIVRDADLGSATMIVQ